MRTPVLLHVPESTSSVRFTVRISSHLRRHIALLTDLRNDGAGAQWASLGVTIVGVSS